MEQEQVSQNRDESRKFQYKNKQKGDLKESEEKSRRNRSAYVERR